MEPIIHPKIDHNGTWSLETGEARPDSVKWRPESGKWRSEYRKWAPESRKWRPEARELRPEAVIRWGSGQYPEFRVQNPRIPGATPPSNILIDIIFS